MENLQKLKMDAWIHWNMSFVGGIFGAYALLNRMDTFGSSETSNMINLVMSILGHDFQSVMLRLGALILYIIGIELTVFLPKFIRADLRYVSIGLDMIAFIIIANLPEDMNFFVALYPIFFVTAVQWCVYGSACGYNSSSIFSTNNLKQFSLSLGHYILEKDEAQLKKFKFYSGTILFFHLGVIYIWYMCRLFGIQSAYAGIVPLLVALLLVKKRRAI